MMLKLKIEHNLPALQKSINRIYTNALPKAVKMALNRTIKSVRSQTGKIFRTERKLKIADINSKHTSLSQASGMSVDAMSASLKISGKSLSLINFVNGSKASRPQKGIKISRRRGIKVEVKPGNSSSRNKLFIAKGASGNIHVFRRVAGSTSSGKGKLLKQNAAGLAQVFVRDKMFKPIDLFASKTFDKEFDRAFAFELSKIS